MSTSPIAFIFDLDGVLADTSEFHYLAWQRLADEEGLPFTRADNEHLRGISRRESLHRLLKGQPIDESTAQAWMARKNAYYCIYLETMTPEDLLPGVRGFLEAARQSGARVGVGSASKNARHVLKRLDLLVLLDGVGDGYSVVHTKPAPDLFLWVAGSLNVPASHAIVFEDAPAGIQSARAAGMACVGIGPHERVGAADLVCSGLDRLTVEQALSLTPG